MSLTAHKPKGLLKKSLHAPHWLYRLHLGWILGEHFLLLKHIGRKTGHLHETVVEVVAHDSKMDTYIVTAGWGEKSDWFQNIMQNPNVEIQVGSRRLAVHAERLAVQPAAQALLTYAQGHQVAFKELSTVIVGKPLAPTLQDCTVLSEKVPVIAFQSRQAAAA